METKKMTEYYQIPVKYIHSSVPKSDFSLDEINDLALAIINSGCLLEPLIVKQLNFQSYELLSGHRNYYAALKAKEIDIRVAEMVSAFVIPDENYEAVLRQIKLLSKSMNLNQEVMIKDDQSENNEVPLQLDQFSQAFQVIQSQNVQILKLMEAQGNNILKRIEQIEQSMKSQLTLAKESRPSSTKLPKLENLTNDQLKSKLREYGIKGYSKMNKDQLIQRLKEYYQAQEKSANQEVEFSVQTPIKQPDSLSIVSYDTFVEESMKVLKKLNSDYNYDNLVPIYHLRRELGDRVDRTQFNEWLLEMHAQSIFELMSGSMPDLTADIVEDSVRSRLGSVYYSISLD
jgi:hypothetical protein